MKKSKTISLSKAIIIIFLLSVLYTYLNVNKNPYTYYDEGIYTFTGKVTEINKIDNGYQLTVKGKEKLIVNVYKNIDILLGNTVKITGEFNKPNENTNFYLFNYRNYLKSEKIYWIVTASKIKIIDSSEGAYKIKNELLDYFSSFKSFNYLNAFILGDDSNINDKVYDSFQINGISHLLAISGMQVSLIAASLLFILNRLNKQKNLNYLIVISFLIFYTFLTSFMPPIIRALSLFILIFIKNALKLKIKNIYLLLLTASIYLFYNPFIIMNIGFLFSFIICFFFFLAASYISKIPGYIKKTFIISVIAYLSSIPILIYNFHEINLLSVFINVIFVPLITFIIYPFSVVTAFIKELDNLFYNLCLWMEDLSLLFSTYDNLVLTLKHINLLGIITYYIVIAITIIKMMQKKYIMLLLMVLILFSHSTFNDKTSYLTMLDVGEGDSIFLKIKDKSILIDTGGQINYKGKAYDYADSIIVPYLKAEGIKKIDYLILTHGDFDHAGNAINLINKFKVDKVIFNNDEYNDLERKIIKTLNKKNIPYEKGVKQIENLKILNETIYDNENDNSTIIYLNYNNKKILLMGDAGLKCEKEITQKYNLKDIDILKVAHHGSATSTSQNFVKTLNPKYSLISVGENNYGHPTRTVLNNLKISEIYRTDKNGSIKIMLDNFKIITCTN